jgi:hypothetical protein
MNNTIVCRATPDLTSSWLVVTGKAGAWNVEDVHSNLLVAIEAVTSSLPASGPIEFPPRPRPALKPTTRLDADFTFTTRAVEDALAAYADHPGDLPGLGFHSHAMLLCPEGGGVEKRWATLHRVGMSGALVGSGLNGAFRPQVLTERVMEWFSRQQWRSFTAPRISERHEPMHQQAHRPSHHRELLVRHNWAAREIAPDAFPPLRLGPAIPPEVEAKRLAKLPQSRGMIRRDKHQANLARFRREAEIRAALREQQEANQ